MANLRLSRASIYTRHQAGHKDVPLVSCRVLLRWFIPDVFLLAISNTYTTLISAMSQPHAFVINIQTLMVASYQFRLPR